MKRLTEKRKDAGLSQGALAKKSGVSVRMIQYYEQGVKDINKAAVETVRSLARTLDCTIEELLE